MKNIFGVLFIALIFLSACKNDKSATTADGVTVVKNDSKALEKEGAVDISDKFVVKQDQYMNEENTGFLFKKQESLNIYTNGSDQLDFNSNFAIAIFPAKTNLQTSFRVNGFDNSGENTAISISTIWGETATAEYRPSYVFTIPQNILKGYPMVKLDDKLIQITTMQ